jgi:hypothetical protein
MIIKPEILLMYIIAVVIIIGSLSANYYYFTKYSNLMEKTKKHCKNIHIKVGDIAGMVPSNVKTTLNDINEEARNLTRPGDNIVPPTSTDISSSVSKVTTNVVSIGSSRASEANIVPRKTSGTSNETSETSRESPSESPSESLSGPSGKIVPPGTIQKNYEEKLRRPRRTGPIFSEDTADCKEALESYCKTKVKLMPEVHGGQGDSPMVKEDACKRAEVDLCKTIQPSAFARCAESKTRKELETCKDDMLDYRRISYSFL